MESPQSQPQSERKRKADRSGEGAPIPATYAGGPSAYLPNSAYFASGAGLPCNLIASDLATAGFTQVAGGGTSEKASAFLITPPGGAQIQISPPGTGTRRTYDLMSQIQLVAGTAP